MSGLRRDAPPDATAAQRARVRVRGAVQGVGFRPFVWSLAHTLDLAGWVLNDDEGVLLEVEGRRVDDFLTRLRHEPPPLARLDTIEVTPSAPTGEDGFAIRESAKTARAATRIPADAAPCPSCLADMVDPANRRWRYAFTNCTHCGPRYTITEGVPYDRGRTSMASFAMCSACQREYDDPADRRFHAQPNACPACGPQLSMDPAAILGHVRDGAIIAFKGLGGFHLIVDARNAAAVARLRDRKRRDAKPFAVMIANRASAASLAVLTAAETELLTDRTRPIVIARARPDAGLAAAVSNGLATVGLMLPSTPAHYLLFHEAAGRPAETAWLDAPQELALVTTSANPGGEPLVTDNDEAARRLGDIADVIVDHDRAIVVRCDDSVMRVIHGAPVYLRRARGATPEPIALPREVPPILAVGGHLKNTVCVTRGREAFLSQHIGDLDNAATYGFFRETIAHLTGILEVTPERAACDLHPDFLSTRFAEETGLALTRVQHHHAHIAAVVAEHGRAAPTLGLALDGFGLGDDRRSRWGGELLRVDGATCARLGGLAPLAQPGGDHAAREPWRMGAAALAALGRGDAIRARFKDHDGADLLAAMVARGVNAPLTSSAGRLFDAACGLLGVKPVAGFEGEAPMALEELATAPQVLAGGWRRGADGSLDLIPLLAALAEPGMTPRDGANLFHGTLAAALVDWACAALENAALIGGGLERCVALSGGCLQNKVLAEALINGFAARNVEALTPAHAPANDGGLSLGQAWVAAHAAGG